MSNPNQTQFRYTQTPSKVLHLRNLPWECIEDELVELCEPFGEIFNTKCNVGAHRNQAFVEFVDLNQAINMVSYYASSSEPASVRGKHVYIQYSNRHEIVNKGPCDVPGNVLMLTTEGVEAGDVSIDLINLGSAALEPLNMSSRTMPESSFTSKMSSVYNTNYNKGVDVNISFEVPDSLLELKELKAKQEQVPEPKAESDPDLIKLWERLSVNGKLKDPIPEVECWDASLLQAGDYGNICHGKSVDNKWRMEKIAIYVEHPRPIDPPAKSTPRPFEPLKLTKKLKKKLRMLRRLTRERLRQDMIKHELKRKGLI